MPAEAGPRQNQVKIDLGPYCPVYIPPGYRCNCQEPESDWDDDNEQFHQQTVPKSRIEGSWFLPEEMKKMPCSSIFPNSPVPER